MRMKRYLYLAIIAGLLAGCHKADQPEKPKHIYFVGAVVQRKYVVEGNYEVVLKRVNGSCPRELLDMKQPVSFPVEPDVWEHVVDHNRMIVIVTEYPLQTNIEVVSFELMKAYERKRRDGTL